MKIAVTGHRGLDHQTATLIDAAIRDALEQLAAHDELTGVSCLADGADQIFAHAILDTGGALEVIIPAKQYRDGLPAHTHARYDALLSKATALHRLEYTESTEAAHMAASVAMLDAADRLLAVWDGQPARGHGGTADVVAHARKLNIPVTVIWPDGARRD